MKIGIIREGKVPPDARVPLTPLQCAEINGAGNHTVVVESSSVRSYTDSEFVREGVDVIDECADCDVLMGVKEIPIYKLISGKTYFFFSHTIKKQPYNRQLLKEIIARKITLIDYEVLTNDHGARLIAFGKYAGMVGAHNALWTYGQRTGVLALPRMFECHDYAEILDFYNNTSFPECRIVLTGTGRVANGAAKVLEDMGYRKITPENFKRLSGLGKVYTQLGVTDYAQSKDGSSFSENDYFNHPEKFNIDFSEFYSSADIMINGIYWDPKAPAFFTSDQMSEDKFNIKVIADVTCDIAPDSSIPSTLRPSTIKQPVFGYNPQTRSERKPYLASGVDMMTIDNLPNELPRDASDAFGQQFMDNILPELTKESSDILDRGTIVKNGELTPRFEYLRDYVS